MKRLIKKANNLAEGQEKFIQECEESGKFNDYQMEEIIKGFENGLIMEQIKVYADPKFDWEQMKGIRKGFEYGLSMEQVKLYADPKLDRVQMDAIKEYLKIGFPIDKIKEKYNLANRRNRLDRTAKRSIKK